MEINRLIIDSGENMQFAIRCTISIAIAACFGILANEARGQIVSDDGELIITSGRIEGLSAKLGNRPVLLAKMILRARTKRNSQRRTYR